MPDIPYNRQNRNKQYISINKHQRNAKNKYSKWLSVQIERQVFDNSDMGLIGADLTVHHNNPPNMTWSDQDNNLWGFSANYDDVGVDGEQFGFFPEEPNPVNQWHGYPVVPFSKVKGRNGNKISKELLDQWVNDPNVDFSVNDISTLVKRKKINPPITLHLYKDHLYCGYLDGTIKAISLNTNFRPKKEKKGFLKNFNINISAYPIKLKGHRNNLFILTEDKIMSHPLIEGKDQNLVNLKSIESCDNFDISPRLNTLFLYSHDAGLVGVPVNSDNGLSSSSKLSYSSTNFKKEIEGDITQIISYENSIFFSERGKGLYRFYFEDKKFKKLSLSRTLKKIKLNNIQDFCFQKNKGILSIIDYRQGLVQLDITTGEIIHNTELISDLQPRQIINIKDLLVIVNKRGLVAYNPHNNQMEEIITEGVAEVSRYYDQLVFLSDGEIGLINFNQKKKINRNNSNQFPEQLNQIYNFDSETFNVSRIR